MYSNEQWQLEESSTHCSRQVSDLSRVIIAASENSVCLVELGSRGAGTFESCGMEPETLRSAMKLSSGPLQRLQLYPTALLYFRGWRGLHWATVSSACLLSRWYEDSAQGSDDKDSTAGTCCRA